MAVANRAVDAVMGPRQTEADTISLFDMLLNYHIISCLFNQLLFYLLVFSAI